jgi:transcriptional regulator with XRE-family HTH domain
MENAESEIRKTFAMRLQKIMDDTGSSQQQVADFVGVKRQTVAQWKDGKTVPDAYNLQRLHQFFNVTYEYLMGESESRQHENLALADSLGLSDDAIWIIQQLKEGNPNNKPEQDAYAPLPRILSEIIGNPLFILSVMAPLQDSIYEYYVSYARDLNISDEAKQENEKIEQFLKRFGRSVVDASALSQFYMTSAVDNFRRTIEDLPDDFAQEYAETHSEDSGK